MYRRFHERFGTAGLIVAVIALIAALGGTAWAAAKLNPTQKKEVKAIAKKFAGKPGAPGATGPAGPAGKEGPEGPAGANGKNGTNGKSVNVGTPTTGECAEGGATVEQEGNAASKQAICNGSPWTAGGTLPSGQTETGTFNIRTTANAGGEVRTTSISFPIPLASPIAIANVRYANLEAQTNHTVSPLCTVNGVEGSAANPLAEKGALCVYEGESAVHVGNMAGSAFVLNLAGGFGTGTTGALLDMSTKPPGTAGEEESAEGTWAVTAE